ncbi:BlaI/MecI/CopY family transcriptional regulator [Antrihabitans spumae]|uniref:BlaI/MecI/CopY family transcriptional regulator n=1 Tax=Antrihabitans spumae TaxID=3373370 RepID=A0ABW7K484_9NOCA
MNGLGSLEARVMDVLWDTTEALTVRDLRERLKDPFAYTTILTVVGHLYDKGWVDRIMHRRAYLYRPRQSRAEATARALREIIDTSNDPEGVLLHFAKTVTEAESEAFRRGLSKPPQRSNSRSRKS